jgi:pentatricopeptide repeat protein
VTYNTLIDACARSQEMFRIPTLLKEMDRQGIEPTVITYSTILKGYCMENKLEKAFEVLEDMKRSQKFLPDEITYNSLLDGCARHGLFERGMSVLADMEESGVVPSNFTLSLLVKLANRSRKPDMAFQLIQDLSQRYHIRPNSHVYSNLVHACTAHDDLRRGMEVLEQMLGEHVRPDSRTYMLLIKACLENKEACDAEGLLRGALGLSGAHSRIAKFSASLVMPRGGMDSAVVSEVLEAVAETSDENALQLMRDLRRVPGLRLDQRLTSRLTAKAINTR